MHPASAAPVPDAPVPNAPVPGDRGHGEPEHSDGTTPVTPIGAPDTDAAPAGPGVELPLRPPVNQASPRAVTWWRLRAVAGFLVLIVPMLVVLTITGGATWAAVSLGVTVVVGVVYTIVVPPWMYRISRWEVTDRAVYTLHGWLVREWRIAPISRVQTVDTERGPLQQMLGLATVTVTTASARGAVEIRGLTGDDAAELARLLTETTQATPGDAT